MKKTVMMMVGTCLLHTPMSYSQEPEPGQQQGGDRVVSRDGFWTGYISRDEVYVVDLNSISNVSMQQYLLKGLLVRELVIDTTGNTIARFYHIEPLKGGDVNPVKGALDQAQDLVKSTADILTVDDVLGVDPQSIVIKQYPETTHSKTVEYRIAKKETIRDLFNSINSAWQEKEAAVYRVK